MSKDKKADYEVGFGKPPRHSQFVPGQSGFKGRKKRKRETQAQMIARVRDELVSVNGETMTKCELAIRSVIAQTVKSGKPRDLKTLFEMLFERGATPEIETAERAKAEGEAVMAKIIDIFEKTHNIDPEDSKAVDALNEYETNLVLSCGHCGPKLRENWKSPEYRARLERYGGSHIQSHILTKQRLANT
jgi:hypothetical protein